MNLNALAGWLSNEEGRALRLLARGVPSNQAIVELGAYKGKSTCFLAQGAREGKRAQVWTYDLWPEDGVRRAFEHQLRKARLSVNARKQDTAKAGIAWKERPVGMLFLDGDHSAEGVEADLRAWMPNLASEPVVAFHDWRETYPGVAQVARQLLGEPTEIIGSLAVYL